MKTKYPFLTLWKEQGLNKFPSIPFNKIREGTKKKFLDYVKDPNNIPLPNPLSKNKPNICEDLELTLLNRLAIQTHIAISEPEKGANSKINDDIDPDGYLDKFIKDFILKEANQLYQNEFLRMGLIVDNAKKMIMEGENRDAVLRELGNQILPDTKGGASIFTPDQWKTLKHLYLELQDCIKSVRRQLDIPLRNLGSSYEWGEDYSDNILEWTPGILDLLDIKELPLLTSKPSIAEISAEIIVKRLNECISTNITSARTLQNQLNAVPLFFL